MSKKEKIKFLVYIVLILVSIPLLVWKMPTGENEGKIESGGNTEHGQAEDTSGENSVDDMSFSSGENDISAGIPEGGVEIRQADLSGSRFSNSTKYEIDIEKLAFTPFETSENKPLVLIIHTYATQGYSVENYLTKNSTLKSEDEKINVISAGTAFAAALEERGIKAIHDKTMFDKISYSNAYSLMVQKVNEYLKEYPSIKYVFDIQRDSLFTPRGNCIKSLVNTDLGKTAQISFISGCDENGADFPGWKNNLSLSLTLSDGLSEINQKLTRGVCLMPSGYGQYACSGFVTVEIGTSGNTPEEAANGARKLAEAFVLTM